MNSSDSPFDLPRILMKSLLATDNNDGFTQAMRVMKQFFSAKDPHDVWNAISNLEKTITKNGQPVSPSLQKSFQSLKEMVGDPKSGNVNAELQNSSGLFNFTSVADVMLGLRSNMNSSDSDLQSHPQLQMHGDMFKANKECEEIENKARIDLEKEAKRLSKEPDNVLLTALRNIKKAAVNKSPIPPLSDMILDVHISNLMQLNMVNDLLQKGKDRNVPRHRLQGN